MNFVFERAFSLPTDYCQWVQPLAGLKPDPFRWAACSSYNDYIGSSSIRLDNASCHLVDPTTRSSAGYHTQSSHIMSFGYGGTQSYRLERSLHPEGIMYLCASSALPVLRILIIGGVRHTLMTTPLYNGVRPVNVVGI